MTEQEARNKADWILGQLQQRSRDTVEADAVHSLIVDALLSAHRVPEGCVRVGEKDFKSRGNVSANTTRDGVVIFDDDMETLYEIGIVTGNDGVDSPGVVESDWPIDIKRTFSTRAAAEAARREGGAK